MLDLAQGTADWILFAKGAATKRTQRKKIVIAFVELGLRCPVPF